MIAVAYDTACPCEWGWSGRPKLTFLFDRAFLESCRPERPSPSLLPSFPITPVPHLDLAKCLCALILQLGVEVVAATDGWDMEACGKFISTAVCFASGLARRSCSSTSEFGMRMGCQQEQRNVGFYVPYHQK